MAVDGGLIRLSVLSEKYSREEPFHSSSQSLERFLVVAIGIDFV